MHHGHEVAIAKLGLAGDSREGACCQGVSCHSRIHLTVVRCHHDKARSLHISILIGSGYKLQVRFVCQRGNLGHDIRGNHSNPRLSMEEARNTARCHIAAAYTHAERTCKLHVQRQPGARC
jgi:hypothetical protein